MLVLLAVLENIREELWLNGLRIPEQAHPVVRRFGKDLVSPNFQSQEIQEWPAQDEQTGDWGALY